MPSDERPNLPPRHTGPVRFVAESYWVVYTRNGLPAGSGSTPEEAAEEAWSRWLPTGITREKWEAMERAVEFVREFASEFGGRPLLDETGYVGQLDHTDCASVLECVLEADAILAALEASA